MSDRIDRRDPSAPTPDPSGGGAGDPASIHAMARALQVSEQKLWAIANYTADWENWFGPDGRLLWVNPAVKRITGYSVEECLAMPDFPLSLFAVENRASMEAAFRRAVGGESGGDLEFVFIRKDGVREWGSASWQPVYGIDGTALGHRSSVRNITKRKQAEAALLESEARFRNLLQDIPRVAVQGYAPDGTTQYWNRASEIFYGFRADEAIGRNLLDLVVPPEMRGAVSEAIHHMAKTGQPIPASELSLMRKDGTRVAVFSSHTIVQVPGRPQELFCLDIDISERKRAEAALRESEETHRVLVESLPDIVLRFDRDGRILFASGNVRRVVSQPPEQVVGKTLRELGLPELQYLSWEEAIQWVFGSGTPFETEVSTTSTQGAATYNWRLIPEKDAQGQVRSALSLSRDITEHRLAERNYQMLFREMLNGFALHEILTDAQGRPTDYRFLAVNPAFERMTGLKAEGLIGRTVLDVMPGTERHWIETYGKVALTGEPIAFENHSVALNKHFEVTAFRPAANQFACVFADITARKQAEAERERLQDQLVQAQKMESIGRLAGGVAHDFNNLLMGIMSYVDMCRDGLAPDHPVRAHLDQIANDAQRSANLTRQLLGFARKQTISPKVLDLNDSVKDMLNLLRRLLGENVELAWIPGAGLWPVRLDPSQVDQVVANLCVNARDAIAGTGRITIETGNVVMDLAACARHADAAPGEYVVLTVSDDGCGMAREVADHIFEPFFTTKSLGQGTGLGLATVYGIVKQNSGMVNVYSEPGKGTTFRVYLPRAASLPGVPAVPTPDAAPRRRSGGQETVLLVEDEASIRITACYFLEALGYVMLVAASPEEALRLAREHVGPINLLLSDVVLPGMDGRQLAGQLRGMYPGLKCLFMSGYTADVIAHRGVLDDDVQFMSKPVSRDDLARKVRDVLDAP